jgi:molecular chaperone GrpE
MTEDERSGEDAPQDDVSKLPETASLEEELEEALREKDQFRTIAQRAQADLANYKRRAAEEFMEGTISAKAHILTKLLSIVDDLDRALEMVPEDAVAPGWLEGLKLVQKKITHVLEGEGVSKIEPLGQPFEPFECEAILYEETPGEEDGQVVKIVRNGYKHHDRVLRAAQVIVSKNQCEQQEEHSQSEEL